jgi:hypothetical protein
LKSIHPKTWKKIENWGREAHCLTKYQYDMAYTLSHKLKNGRNVNDIERIQGETILNIVVDKNPELFFNMEDYFNEADQDKVEEIEITIELIERIVVWDKKNKRLDAYKYIFMLELLEGKKTLTERNKELAKLNLKAVERFGFK